MLFPWKQLAVWVLHIVVLTNLPPGCIGREYVYTTANCRLNEGLSSSDTDAFIRLQYDGNSWSRQVVIHLKGESPFHQHKFLITHNSSRPVTCSWNVYFYKSEAQYTWEAQIVQLGVFSTCRMSSVTISMRNGDNNQRRELGHICSTNRPLFFTGNRGDTLIVEYKSVSPQPWDTFLLSYRRLSKYDDRRTCRDNNWSCRQSTNDQTKYYHIQKSSFDSKCVCKFESSSKEVWSFLALQVLNNTYTGSCNTTYLSLTNDNDLNVRVCPGQKTSVIYGRSPVMLTVTDPGNIFSASIDILYRAVSFWSDEQVIDASNATREMQTLTLQTPAGYDRPLDITWFPRQNPYFIDDDDSVTVLNVTYFRRQSDANECSDSSLRLSEQQGRNEMDVCKTTPHFPLVYRNLYQMTYRTNYSVGTYEFSLRFFRFYEGIQSCAGMMSTIFNVGLEETTIYGVKMSYDSRDMLCRYSLRNTELGEKVEVNITYLSLGAMAEDCKTNYFHLFKDVYESPIETHCPGSGPFSATFRDKYLHIKMAIANPLLGNGFSMTFKRYQEMFDCSDSPKIVALGNEDDVTVYYPPGVLDTSENFQCTWIFQSVYGQITLTVPNVIADQYVCGEAYVKVRDGRNDHDPLVANICSNSLKRVFTSSQHYLHVEIFIKARRESQPKLSLQLRATVGEVCKDFTEISIIDSSISLIVPQYYGSSGTCVWKITSAKQVPDGSQAVVQMKYIRSAHESCKSLESLLSVRDERRASTTFSSLDRIVILFAARCAKESDYGDTNLDKPTSVGDHCQATVSLSNTSILTREPDWTNRKVKKAIYICSTSESHLNTDECDVYQSKGDVLFVNLHLGQLQPVYNAKRITMDLSTVIIPCSANTVYEVSTSKTIRVNVKDSSNIKCLWVFRRSQVGVPGFLVANVSYEYTYRNGDITDCDRNTIIIYDGDSNDVLLHQKCFGYEALEYASADATAKGHFKVETFSDTLMLQLLWQEPQNNVSLVITVSSVNDSGTNTALIVSLISVSIVVILTMGMCLIYRRCIRKRPHRPPRPPVQSSLHNMDEVFRVEDTFNSMDQEPAHTEQADAPPSYEESQVQTTTFTTDPALPSYKYLFPDTMTYI